MVTKSDKLDFDNLKNKLELALAKLDTIEQEKAEIEKENQELKKQNTKIQAEAFENYDKLYHEIVKINDEVSSLKGKKRR